MVYKEVPKLKNKKRHQKRKRPTYLVVGIFKYPKKGFLLEKTTEGKLRIPGCPILKSLMINKRREQKKQEINALSAVFHKLTGDHFIFKSIAEFTSEQRKKIIRAYLTLPVNEYLESPDQEFELYQPTNNLIFVPADQTIIEHHPQILSDDKRILLDFLKNETTYWRKEHSPVITVKAIA